MSRLKGTQTTGKFFKIGSIVLALLFLPGQAWAESFCANPEEETALKVAALQEELMVAALSCSETRSYNRFVLAYRGELQRSDAVLKTYFLRRDPESGETAYNAYKTKLANDASLRSLHDLDGYCVDARTAFDDALARRDQPLGSLVSDRQSVVSVSDEECTDGRRYARGR